MSTRSEKEEQQRIVLLYSLNDLALANSAANFLLECDPDEKYCLEDLRRFRCFETTCVISYARPFFHAGLPRLSQKKIKLNLTQVEQSLHNELIEFRNKVVAHSDFEKMRMVSKVHFLGTQPTKTEAFVQTAFDEGLNFIGLKTFKVLDLIGKHQMAIYKLIHSNAENEPEAYEMRIENINDPSGTRKP